MSVNSIVFHKMHGAGNDFILVDNRALNFSRDQMSRFAVLCCERAKSIGADGAIFIDHSGDHHPYRWHFYNRDGSRGEMCGNGARCVAYLAVKLGIAENKHVFLTDVGSVEAEVMFDEKRVKVRLTNPKQTKLNISCDEGLLHFVDTGVPHVVKFVDNVDTCNVELQGKRIRYHELFAPDGANVDFVQLIDQDHAKLRTYERGVERETFACGTGAAAAAYIAHKLGKSATILNLITMGQDILTIEIEPNETIFLTGSVEYVFGGRRTEGGGRISVASLKRRII